MTRVRKVMRVAFAVHVALGAAVTVVLLFGPPLTIGAGRFDAFAKSVEAFDWRWVLLVPVLLLWVVPLLAVLAWLRARRAGLEVERVSAMMTTLLQHRQIPIAVDVDQTVPVEVASVLRVPMELNTRIAVDDAIDIETTVPIHATLPLDTEVETSVFGLGTIKIPIRGNVPLNLTLPIVGKIHVRSAGLPVHLKDEVTIQLPRFEVPIRSRLETRIDLLDNLSVAAEHLRKRLGRDDAPAPPEAP